MSTDEKMYRSIVEAVPEGIWVVNSDGRTIFSNQRMANILGTNLESMYRQTCFDCVYPEDAADAQRQFARNVNGDCRPFDFRLRRADGSAVWVSISCMPVRDDTGAAFALLGLFSDITERRRAEADLRESEERFRTMADTAPVMIWVSDPNMVCTFVSQGWLTFTGRTMEQELGVGWAEGVYPDDRDRCRFTCSSSFAARSRYQMEYRLRRHDGEYRWILVTGVPRFEADGAFAGYVGSCLDITDFKRAQEDALARQKLESLGVLASGIAHDFNNLLGGILASAEVALTELAGGSPVEAELRSISTTAIRGAEIVNQLLLHAGDENPAFEPLELSALVGEMLQLLKVSISNATLKTDLRHDLPVVQANAGQLRQVVMNLVINAAEAIGDRKGEICITTSLAPSSRDAAGDAAGLPNGNYLQLEVSDTGVGMTPDVQARIFDPFFSTKQAGRGLGLSAIQGIIRSHGGAIHVVSAPGQGSRFLVLLPCSGRPAQSRPGGAELASARERKNSGATVLIIEDEFPLRMAVAKMLRKEGYCVIEAGDGAFAVEQFRARAPEIDVVLLDLSLPEKPGHQVLQEMRRIRADVKVVLTTAYSEDIAMTSLGGQRPWDYIRKPYQLSDLMHLLHNLSGSAKMTESAMG